MFNSTKSKILWLKTKNISDFVSADSASVFTQLHPIWSTCFGVIIGWLCVGKRSVNFGRLLGIWNKKVEKMVWTVERFHEMTTLSCAADEMNHSLLATKNASLYHHSLDTPYCKNRMFWNVLFQNVSSWFWILYELTCLDVSSETLTQQPWKWLNCGDSGKS